MNETAHFDCHQGSEAATNTLLDVIRREKNTEQWTRRCNLGDIDVHRHLIEGGDDPVMWPIIGTNSANTAIVAAELRPDGAAAIVIRNASTLIACLLEKAATRTRRRIFVGIAACVIGAAAALLGSAHEKKKQEESQTKDSVTAMKNQAPVRQSILEGLRQKNIRLVEHGIQPHELHAAGISFQQDGLIFEARGFRHWLCIPKNANCVLFERKEGKILLHIRTISPENGDCILSAFCVEQDGFKKTGWQMRPATGQPITEERLMDEK